MTVRPPRGRSPAPAAPSGADDASLFRAEMRGVAPLKRRGLRCVRIVLDA